MGMNDTPSSERLHIGFFGRRNAGKSSVVNAVTNQNMSLVSDKKRHNNRSCGKDNGASSARSCCDNRHGRL